VPLSLVLYRKTLLLIVFIRYINLKHGRIISGEEAEIGHFTNFVLKLTKIVINTVPCQLQEKRDGIKGESAVSDPERLQIEDLPEFWGCSTYLQFFV
jgi:hypothetical protein